MTRGKRERARQAAIASSSQESDAFEVAEEFARSIRKPLAPGDPRLHHFVPQHLLRGFSNERQRLATIRLDCPTEFTVRSIAKTAAIRDFHTTIDVEVGETVAVERLIAQIEGDANGVLKRLCAARKVEPSDTDRASLALFVALQFVRGPGHRRVQEALADMAMKMEATMRENRERVRQEDLVERDAIEYAPHQNEHIALMLQSAEELAPHIASRPIAVLRFNPPGLLISDQPVVLYTRPENRHPFLGVGVANADEIWLPVNRNTALVFHRDSKLGDRRIEVANDPSEVRDFNQQIVTHAFAEVYAHPDDAPVAISQLSWPSRDRPLLNVEGVDWVRGTTDGVNAAPSRQAPRRYRRHPDHP